MMCTYLQRVTATQLAELVGKPESIAKLDAGVAASGAGVVIYTT